MKATAAEQTTLRLTRIFAAPRERVFRAWTDAKELGAWFHAGDDWMTPIAEVDFRVGGQYRLGMQSPENDFPYVVTGVYKEIAAPDKIVYTWRWEGEDSEETLVTVNFREQDNKTQVELIHERFATSEERDKHGEGWRSCMEQCADYIEA